MQLKQTLDVIWFALGTLGLLFTVYSYFHDPVVKADKRDALLEQSLKNMEDRINEKFTDLSGQFANMRDNHMHTIDVKVDENNKNYNLLAMRVEKLSTIIEERIPRIRPSRKTIDE